MQMITLMRITSKHRTLGTGGMRHAALVAIALASGFGTGVRTAAAAEPTTNECLAASERAVTFREQHRLLAAREALLVCASASCPGDVREECTRRVEEGTPAPVGAPIDSAADEGMSGTAQRILGFTAMGLGVGGLVVGLVFELERSNKQSESDAICPTSACPPAETPYDQSRVNQLTGEANSAATISVTSFVAGGALLVAGLALVLTAPSNDRDVALAPVVVPGFGGIAASGRF